MRLKGRNKKMIKISTTESKITPKKKNIALKNISAVDLVLVDTDTGEDIAEQVLSELPAGVTTVDFKITIEIPEE